MSFGKYLNKLTDKLQDRIPPQIPFSNKPTPPIPTSSKPSSSSASQPNQPYWRADFSPSTPVTANFGHECGHGVWGNNELENYTNAPENSYHTPNHCLVVRAIISGNAQSNKYTSARLTSHQRLQLPRGYVEATITAPSAKGIWPAFWLLPYEPFKWPEDGEVDIMESWNGEKANHTCLHWGHYNGEDWNKHRVVDTDLNLSKTHVYGFAWESEGGKCLWYIDGKTVMRATKPAGTRPWEDFRVLLNVAIGGDVCKGAVPRDGAYEMVVHEVKMCELPAAFEADWVRTKEGHAM